MSRVGAAYNFSLLDSLTLVSRSPVQVVASVEAVDEPQALLVSKQVFFLMASYVHTIIAM